MAPLAARTRTSARVAEDDLGIIARGLLVVDDGLIAAVGTQAECKEVLSRVRARAADGFEEIDAGGSLVLPGFIDAHTHALFAGERIADFEALARGDTPKLGIAYTVEQTRRCDAAQLVDIGARHLELMASHGTTTAEIKSGYALTADGEARLLQAMQTLDARTGLPHVVATFCGAHALPPEFASYDAFVDELCGNILPQVAKLGIAKFADAFCETNYFSPEQCRRFLQACAAAGMKLRLHADELSPSGGARLAAELRCASADHLNFIDDADIALLAESGVTAVLCPATTDYLDLGRWAPARALIENGVPVALATDFNPGTSPCCSLQTVAHLARRHLHMTLAETVAAVTTHAARSLGIETTGALIPGFRADAVMLDIADIRAFGYYFGANLVKMLAFGV
jgi:imidazolonepropionase